MTIVLKATILHAIDIVHVEDILAMLMRRKFGPADKVVCLFLIHNIDVKCVVT